LVGNEEDYTVDMAKVQKDKILLYAEKSMGNGKIDNIHDVIFVDSAKFNKLKTLDMVTEIERLNQQMLREGKQYLLIGPGRWGTRDQFIGIPVAWPQISNAKVIVEMSMEDFPLDASLGSHFFHNVTSMNVGYFSVQSSASDDYIAWDVLKNQQLIQQTTYFKHIRFENPLTVTMDGRKRIAVITWWKYCSTTFNYNIIYRTVYQEIIIVSTRWHNLQVCYLLVSKSFSYNSIYIIVFQ